MSDEVASCGKFKVLHMMPHDEHRVFGPGLPNDGALVPFEFALPLVEILFMAYEGGKKQRSRDFWKLIREGGYSKSNE